MANKKSKARKLPTYIELRVAKNHINSEFEEMARAIREYNVPEEIIEKMGKAICENEDYFDKIEPFIDEFEDVEEEKEELQKRVRELELRLSDLEFYKVDSSSLVINGLNILQRQRVEDFISSKIFPFCNDFEKNICLPLL